MTFLINNRIAKFAATLSLLVIVFTSCKKNNFAVDVDPLAVPTAAQFLPADGVARVSYYVTSTPTAAYKIPVGLTDVATVDRTIQFTYSSATAVAGVQYTAPATLTIKAGQSIDTLAFQGIFAGYPANRRDTVKVKFTGLKGVDRKDSFELILQRYCAPNLVTLAGNYANTNEYTSSGAFSYGPYTTVVKNLVQTSSTTATAQIENIYDWGWNDINCTLNWANPAAFSVSIPLQVTGGGTPTSSVRTSTATGAVSTFSACDNTLTFDIDLVTTATGAVTTSKYQIRMVK